MTWHTPRNFASTTVTSGDLNNTTTPITFSVADGSQLGSTWPMYATVDPTGTPEVIEITARTGDSITATRASAIAHTGAPTLVCAVAAEYVTELQAAIDLKSPLASPTFTGTPAAPTAAGSTNTTQIATTAFVQQEISTNAALPWLIEVPIFLGHVARTGFTISYIGGQVLTWNGSGTTAGSNADQCMFANAAFGNPTVSAINDYVDYNVVLGAGTWTIRMMYYSINDGGIANFKIDGTSVGTIDTYTAGTGQRNKYGEITGITVATSGKKTLKILMDTKNGSSSGYSLMMHQLVLVRTA